MTDKSSMDRFDDVRIVSGRELPAQYHLGRVCRPDWVEAADPEYENFGILSVKPSGALWTSTATQRNPPGRIATTWSETYFKRAYNVERERRTPWGRRLRQKLTPERQWPVQPDPDARILRLGTVADLQAAAARWPTPHGHISFQAMAEDGIDGVWVEKNVIPDSWGPEDRDRDDANIRAAFYGWEVESVAWLRADHLTVGQPVRVFREEQSSTAAANMLLQDVQELGLDVGEEPGPVEGSDEWWRQVASTYPAWRDEDGHVDPPEADPGESTATATDLLARLTDIAVQEPTRSWQWGDPDAPSEQTIARSQYDL